MVCAVRAFFLFKQSVHNLNRRYCVCRNCSANGGAPGKYQHKIQIRLIYLSAYFFEPMPLWAA